MKKTLTVSVAAYNIEEYIDNTVESITNSDVIDDIEIIIVNDGSKDRTSQKAHALADRFPDSIIVIDKENGGYGSTINTSIRKASGKYYKLLDGDDWYRTDNLKEFIDFLKESESDIIVTPYYRVGDTESLYDNHQEIPSEDVQVEDILVEQTEFAMHELAVKTDVYKGFNNEITENCFYTDVEFTCNSFIAIK